MSEISRFFINGKLSAIPKKMRSKMAVFDFLLEQIEQKGTSFSEKELNEILKVYYDDYALLRRYLVDFGFLSRDKFGIEYVVIKERGNKNEEHYD